MGAVISGEFHYKEAQLDTKMSSVGHLHSESFPTQQCLKGYGVRKLIILES